MAPPHHDSNSKSIAAVFGLLIQRKLISHSGSPLLAVEMIPANERIPFQRPFQLGLFLVWVAVNCMLYEPASDYA